MAAALEAMDWLVSHAAGPRMGAESVDYPVWLDCLQSNG